MAIDETRNGKPSGIQLVQVEGFLEVARRGSVSRAAEALFITQPTLTARLQGLERELGTPLFLRTPHGMRLTDAGRAWVPFAERALRALVDGRDALQQVMTASAGHLMIGAAPAVSTYVLPELLERFVSAHPRVEVSVRTGHTEDVVELVLRDEVQIGLGRAIRHPELELRPFHTEDLILVCARDHPFTKRKAVTMAEVAGQKLIMFDHTSSYYEITHGAFLAAGISLRSLMELDSIEAAKKMVERGLGVALLPGTAVGREIQTGTLCAVKMADAPVMQNTIVAFRRRDAGAPEGIVAAFLQLLESR
ncbi:MAG TPA: LysR family transcriptional regulator [Candidatus Dormibacteraeota bacterium]|jgi:DNA-binding transcriptional LysR family regulator|nr:LysR family transcriptional regulator [Candidatus Dormibacteraeota bacterium]HEX2680506.1 LysR family transcriptional regulator [Candidatus Dormibacteraeota bacterium]